MARIPEHVIEQVREANNIVDVIGEYVQLKRSGRNWFGRCPFHDEKTPSFSVSPDKQIYHCFGCGAGGNVINFIMEHERLEFLPAVKLLADRAQITLEFDGADRGPDRDEQAQFYNLHELATRIYERQLESKSGADAREYLQKRSLTDEILKTFRVGFVEDTWETFTLEAMKLGLPREVLTSCGLLMTRNDGSFYDRFRGRIMFPITGIHDKVLAFGGRVFGTAEGAKYMNSPETPIYHKGRTLYGLNKTKEPIRSSRSAILVEGYMDLIRLYQEGYMNVVAGTGTALTSQQAAGIKRFADKVYVCYDSDSAGLKAAMRAGLTCLDVGLDVRVVELPDGEDPDSFFDSHESSEFEPLMEHAADYIPFVIASEREQLQTASGRAAFIQDFVSDLGVMENALLRDMLAGQLADELRVPESNILKLLARQTRRVTRRAPAGQKESRPRKSAVETAGDRAEVELLRLHLSSNEDILEWLTSTIKDEDVDILKFKQLFQLLRGRLRKEFPINRNRLLDDVESEDIRRVLVRLIHEVDQVPESLKLAGDCLDTIRSERSKRDLEKLRIELRKVEREGGDIRPLMEKIKLLKQK